MSRWLRDFRLIPVVLLAVCCLFALKATGLILDGGYTLGQRLNRTESITVTTVPASSSTALRSQTVPLDVASARSSGQKSWAQEMLSFPDVTGTVAGRRAPAETIVTGSVGSTKEPPKEAPKETPKDAAAKPPGGKDAGKDQPPGTKPAAGAEKAGDKPVDLARPDSKPAGAERAILERLLERRQELEARARELELRENLLKAAEKNLEAKLATLKDAESRGSGNDRKDPAEAARFKNLITMYETMKPKEAAKIFDRLDSKVLLEVSSQINPRRMSEIMAQMSAEVAERLTVEFAARAGEADRSKANDLPKIDGKPSGG